MASSAPSPPHPHALYWKSRGSTLSGMRPSRWLSTSSWRGGAETGRDGVLAAEAEAGSSCMARARRRRQAGCMAHHPTKPRPSHRAPAPGSAHLDHAGVVDNVHMLNGHRGRLTYHDAPQRVGQLGHVEGGQRRQRARVGRRRGARCSRGRAGARAAGTAAACSGVRGQPRAGGHARAAGPWHLRYSRKCLTARCVSGEFTKIVWHHGCAPTPCRRQVRRRACTQACMAAAAAAALSARHSRPATMRSAPAPSDAAAPPVPGLTAQLMPRISNSMSSPS